MRLKSAALLTTLLAMPFMAQAEMKLTSGYILVLYENADFDLANAKGCNRPDLYQDFTVALEDALQHIPNVKRDKIPALMRNLKAKTEDTYNVLGFENPAHQAEQQASCSENIKTLTERLADLNRWVLES
ncbi:MULTISPECIES: hypothetical protein [Pseudomonas]|jgi:hypothetical protein|uniref:Uncharacterized protein n=2 Tax=Pseudomonas TaxID=286 RepID=A0ABY0VB55_9PSED|nr:MULTISPECIES: hypothetical protein [Pseudomonas]MSU96539.1 hypothetical protein [Pseudomonas mandelii]PMV84641.1 hypothetical protein C1X56_22145 [Pseudomonas sp. GW101-1A09]PMV93054.1 hypothetical protein C1X55_27415 [Pseudomonas sp. GW460-C8]PMV93500.1 hypothetical protein C1X51_15335 [Pseudomonas sp. FW306-2-2C-B10A]PMW05975.1 hypothetical protein C1X50_10275 [Pseudomonas sp. MPR-TSA4]